MKYGLLLLLFSFLSSPFLSAQPLPEHENGDESFTFVQISDPQLGFREESGFAEGEALLTRAVAAINLLRPAFVVVTGDMVNNSNIGSQTAAYKRLIGLVDKSIPVWHIPGNHDIGRYSPEHLAAYVDHYGYERFAFSLGGNAFVGIDTCPIKEGVVEAEQEQYKWLEEQLEGFHSSQQQIFLFVHCPIVLRDIDEEESYSNFPKAVRARYVELLSRYGVKAVFAGHLHNTSRCTIGSTEMITSGPSGKPLGNGFSGVAIIDVTPNDYTYRYVGLDDPTLLLNR